MAVDEALLDDVVKSGGAFLRLYRWDPPTLSIGRNQPLDDVIPDAPWVRRPTGGQAVWHEHEVTYAVAAPIAQFGSLRNAYCQIHTRIAAALRSLGVDALLAPAPLARPGRPTREVSCFAAPVGGEIIANGRKLVGSAQVRRADAFLQHGSILLDGSQPSSCNGATTLGSVLGRTVSFDEAASALIGAWGEPLTPVSPLAPVPPVSVVASLAQA
jgi:lipoyl(octanoyl) transferase